LGVYASWLLNFSVYVYVEWLMVQLFISLRITPKPVNAGIKFLRETRLTGDFAS
jgi:hypothetical protein